MLLIRTIPQSACSADSPLYTRGPLVRTAGTAGGYDFVGADSISARKQSFMVHDGGGYGIRSYRGKCKIVFHWWILVKTACGKMVYII